MRRTWTLAPFLALFGALYAWQMPFREYPGMEYNTFPKPADWDERTEWCFARLMYPQTTGGYGRGFGGYGGGGGRRGEEGRRGGGYTRWGGDAPAPHPPLPRRPP